MSQFWNYCTPPANGRNDISQETGLPFSEHVGSLIGPTLMQSKRSAWGQCRIDKASRCCNGGLPDRTVEANFGLEMLRRMAEEEAEAAREASSQATTCSGSNMRSTPRQDEVQIVIPAAGGKVTSEKSSTSGQSTVSLFTQLDARQEHIVIDQEEPSNPPLSSRVALLLETQDRDAQELRSRLEREAIERSNVAREEREIREKVRAFLTAHGYRHVRAKCSLRTMSKTHALHSAVWCNDAGMARLLLNSRADPTQVNTWGQTPLQYAQRRNSRQGSHEAVLQVLQDSPPRP